MGEAQGLQPQGEKLRKAVKWIAATQRRQPATSRRAILEQAQIRFDLSPKECEFLDRNFEQPPGD